MLVLVFYGVYYTYIFIFIRNRYLPIPKQLTAHLSFPWVVVLYGGDFPGPGVLMTPTLKHGIVWDAPEKLKW